MFVPVTPVAGVQPFNDWFVPDATQRHGLGTRVDAYDPYWGYGGFVYAKAAAAQERGSICTLGLTSGVLTATDAANTANTGAGIVVAMNTMASGAFGWYQDAGMVILSATGSVAAGVAVGVTGAGTVGANSAGKQLLGFFNSLPGTTTKIINATTKNGSPILVCNGDYSGWFVGAALSGTGIPASTIISKLDPDGRTVVMGATVGAADKLATASATVAVTATYTGFLVGYLNHGSVQGAIT